MPNFYTHNQFNLKFKIRKDNFELGFDPKSPSDFVVRVHIQVKRIIKRWTRPSIFQTALAIKEA